MGLLSGWNYRQPVTIDSSTKGLSGNLTDLTVAVRVPSSNTGFWAGVKADGTDVRFTASDGTTLLKFEIEKFDSTGDDAVFHVKVPSLLSASNTTIYLYYGNASAASGEDRANAWDSSYRTVLHLNQDSPVGAFYDSKNNLSGTNSGTTDATGKIDKGRNVQVAGPLDISFADDDLLSFGNGAADTDMTITAWVKMTDATRFRILSKGISGTNHEYIFVVSGGDTLLLKKLDASSGGSTQQTSTGPLTADEGSWVHLAVTSVGTTTVLYRNGAVFASSVTTASYTAMENGTGLLYVGSYFHTDESPAGNGVIDEITLSAAARSADWLIAGYQSGLGTWLSFGAQEGTLSISDTAVGTDGISLNGVIPVADTGTGLDDIVLPFPSPDTGTGIDEITVAVYVVIADAATGADTEGLDSKLISIDDIISGADGLSAFTGDQYIITETGAGTDGVSVTTLITVTDTVMGTDSVALTGNTAVLLLVVMGFPSAQTVEYQIEDGDGTLIQDWTVSGVSEKVIGNKSTYRVWREKLTNAIVNWRIPSTTYEATEVINIYSSLADGTNLTAIRAAKLDYLDRANSESLASAAYTAPDNAGIASLLTYAVSMSKWKNNKLVEVDNGNGTSTFTLYDDNGSTPLLTWVYTTSTKTRAKAT